MIIVKGASRRNPSDQVISYATGETDEFGNPFEVIELISNVTRYNMHAEYEKTRGFDDAVISYNNGLIRISYRKKKGSIMWMRPLGNVGPFIGKIPRTPRNMRMLASHYRDGLWRIKNAHIEAEVKKMSDMLWEEMPDEIKKFNEARIKRLQMLKSESVMNQVALPTAYSNNDDKAYLDQEKVEIARQKIELAQREAEIAKREKLLAKDSVKKIETEGNPSKYSQGYLQTLGLAELRKLGRTEYGLQYNPRHAKQDVIGAILAIQAGEVPATNEDIEQPENEMVSEGVAD